jgi:hypothetical protein
LDDSLERQQQQWFRRRDVILDELDRALVSDSVDRWVVLTGGVGTGKTAILISLLARREADGGRVAHHFVQRQRSDRMEPSTVVRSLAAQIEAQFPAQRDPHARPQARLSELLARVSDRELSPRGAAMVLLIDGLDERHPVSEIREVLAFLPRALPRGIRVLCAGRRRDPASHGFEDRTGQLVRLDLDDPSFADDNDATVRAVSRREAPGLALDERFVERAVACSGGNVLYAASLCVHLESVPHSQRTPEALPRGLSALLATLWGRVEDDAAASRALGILCTARAPLSIEQIARVAGWRDLGLARAAMHVGRALVVEVRRADHAPVYGLFHDAMRSYILERLGPNAVRAVHCDHAEQLASWPAAGDPAQRRYALHHAVGHRIAAGDCKAVHMLARDVDCLHDERHDAQVVPGDALAQMIETMAHSARLVVLNACYSDVLAAELCEVVECVVGMSQAIHDDAALSFAVAFYRALGNRFSVGTSFKQGLAILAAKHRADRAAPRCRTRNGIHAHDTYLDPPASKHL